MIQRFTCVPAEEYEALVVTNGSVDQVESSICKINDQCHDFTRCTIVYFDNLRDLFTHLQHNENTTYHGKVLFMFFNGLEYVQEILGDLIDNYNDRWQPRSIPYNYSLTLIVKAGTDAQGVAARSGTAASCMERLDNAYFYFDSSVCNQGDAVDTLFLSIVCIAQDILKKSAYLIGRIRGLFIDDANLAGERVYPLHSLFRNFPAIERVELTSAASVAFNDLVL